MKFRLEINCGRNSEPNVLDPNTVAELLDGVAAELREDGFPDHWRPIAIVDFAGNSAGSWRIMET